MHRTNTGATSKKQNKKHLQPVNKKKWYFKEYSSGFALNIHKLVDLQEAD